MDWLNGFDSASFSVRRCSKPICGSAFWMTSPSISSTRRNTPCAAGCCGPKFIVKLRISFIASLLLGLQRRVVAVVVADDLRHQRALLDRDRLVHHALLGGVVAHLDVADQREVLAERMADEAVVGEDAAQIRVTGEKNAEQVERLALEPVGTRPDVDQRIDDGIFRVDAARTQTQTLIVRDRQQVVRDGETRAVVRLARCAAIYATAETGRGR